VFSEASYLFYNRVEITEPDMECLADGPDGGGRRSPRRQFRQEEVNRAVYESSSVYRQYLSRKLTPSEVACLRKYDSHIAEHDVLDIGVGAGRTTSYLAKRARCYEAIDFSAVMVRYMRKSMPEVRTRQADFRDLSVFDDGSFDFVFAPNNVIDALSHDGRMQALNEAFRVLRPGAHLALSSHNLNYRNAFKSPRLEWTFNPLRLAARCGRYLSSCFNYFRLKPMLQVNPEYAVLNDPGHNFACLHYYVSRSVMGTQLSRVGLRLEDVFDSTGQEVSKGLDDCESPTLLYVCQRPWT
jgi:ubiquinone/menaquinone biosynthesis C-methylase UbiE